MPHTFVLVHGAWHGGWCWRRVSDLLERQGHKVFTPTLTGLGERSHLLRAGINVSTHVTDVVNVLKWEGLSDVVLCGHSYGGWWCRAWPSRWAAPSARSCSSTPSCRRTATRWPTSPRRRCATT